MADHDERVAVRLSAQETAQLGEQISGLARAGLPLPTGLKALGEELPAGHLRQMIDELSVAIEGGSSLEQAFAAQGRRLPDYLRGLVRAGERTGRTGEILGRFAGYAHVGVEVRRLLWLNLAYPVASLAMASAVILFILTYLVSDFGRIFEEFGIPLPLLSRFLVTISAALRIAGWILVGGTAAVVAVGIATMLLIGPAARRSVSSRIPLLGPVWRWTSLAEYCHLLGLLVESELPLSEAVRMAGEGVPDRDVQAVTRTLVRELEEGEPLDKAIERQSFFPDGLGRIVAWAETHQSLHAALHMLAEMFEARARAQASFASTVCSILTVLVILGGIFAVVVGVMTPLIMLLQKLSG